MTLMETAQLLGNFGEFFGAIAVVVTLVYIAVQVSQSRDALNANTRATKGALSYQAANRDSEMNSQMIGDPDLPNLMMNAALREPPKFTQEEENRLYLANRVILQSTEALYYLHKNDLIEDEYWQARLQWTVRWLARPYTATWWNRDRKRGPYSPSFVNALDQQAWIPNN